MTLLSPVIHPKKHFFVVVLSAIAFCIPSALASSARIVNANTGSNKTFALRATPEVLHFKNVTVGQTSLRHVALTNSSGSEITLTGMAQTLSVFRIQGLKFPIRLAANKSVTFEAAFTPRRRGTFNSDFTFHSRRFQYPVLHTDGKGVARADAGLTSNPRRLDFGNVNTGSFESRRLTLSNFSATDQTVEEIRPSQKEFSFNGITFPLTLAPNESITFDVFFAPIRVISLIGDLTVESPENDFAIAVAGRGRNPGQVAISPATLNFGNVNLGAQTTLTGTLHAGTAGITIYSAGITSSEFALGGISFPTTIPARHSLSFAVTFLPKANGYMNATMSFRTSAATSGIGVALTGIGAIPVSAPTPSHRVTLTWNSAGDGISGYDIYRGTTSGGPYAKLNSIPDSNTNYLDSNVLGGETYYYVTTARASNGTQSGFSNQIEVSIP